MHFIHIQKIWNQFPQLVPGLMTVDGIRPQVNVDVYIQPLYEQARLKLCSGPESQMPEIAAWRQVYSQMGLKPSKYRSAAEALLRRFKRESDLPRLHPLVDFCNALSIASALPVAVFDLDRVTDYLEVRYAKGAEEYLAFNGEIENPNPGEIIFADAAGKVHARRWTFRQSRLSTIRPETTRVLILSEGMHEGAIHDVDTVMDSLDKFITGIWASPKCRAILTAEFPRKDFT
ncbi:MAG: phenylalanine--tRNA ligase beta subunit-related protein [Desulfobacterales bacterium]|jgi:DNA/RNA-binding domain of Phe-tRNA-synthetase-like protein|nr:hypothetical protein [Desulfobacter sp.]MDP6395748.1 phenylalanine--tRNA ligase beta subunit-related protein [Desulfobacterales bacterium]MDP6681759.1 phenylalanine--tRNA ligase beta subunit-related protein [Desulfobacterales bacterium]MDP6807494.1 phenylalanine--tRNA ligase beta subunit-related protein [Desulfobacterales bacterium]|tara:strand:+ start:15820 stop:16515 length:696 start_codon:yes stop_codon:yes gene_type:complete